MGRKWNNIKMKKAASDKARSQNYTKVLRDIMMAVKNGGVEAESNFALKVALLKAREFNVPKDNVEKAIKKASGVDAENWEEASYECYGPEGVAIFIDATTNNPTRTAGNIRAALNRWSGSMGKEGCLQFIFERKAAFTISSENIDLDDLTMLLIDAGAEDLEKDEDVILIKGEVENYGSILNKLEELKIKPIESGLKRLPLNMKKISVDGYKIFSRLIDILEADDDVQEVYHNLEWDDAFENIHN